MAPVIETLRDEHRQIGRLLDALERQISIFEQGGTPDYDVISGIADYFLEFPDRCHHPKEDIVFSQLQVTHAEAAASVGDLMHEHALVHDRAIRFRATVDALLNDTDIPRDAIVEASRQFIDLERRHMRREEAQFLPLAERVLTPQDWARIEGALAPGEDPLFGGKVASRFRKLSDRLLAWDAETATP